MSYKPGSVIEKMGDLLWALHTEPFIFHRKRLTHSKWAMQWSLAYAIEGLEGTHLRFAVEISETKIKQRKKRT